MLDRILYSGLCLSLTVGGAIALSFGHCYIEEGRLGNCRQMQTASFAPAQLPLTPTPAVETKQIGVLPSAPTMAPIVNPIQTSAPLNTFASVPTSSIAPDVADSVITEPPQVQALEDAPTIKPVPKPTVATQPLQTVTIQAPIGLDMTHLSPEIYELLPETAYVPSRVDDAVEPPFLVGVYR